MVLALRDLGLAIDIIAFSKNVKVEKVWNEDFWFILIGGNHLSTAGHTWSRLLGEETALERPAKTQRWVREAQVPNLRGS